MQHFKEIIEQLNDYLAVNIETAVEFAQARRHFEVTFEHVLLKILEKGDADLVAVLNHYEIKEDNLWEDLLNNLNKQRSGNQGKPLFSFGLFRLLEKAVIANSLYYKQPKINSIALLDAFIELAESIPGNLLNNFSVISLNDMRHITWDYYEKKIDNQAVIINPFMQSAGDTALARYTHHITEKARLGKIDPVFGRDMEIRMMIDILSRRRKNNPILVGDPGVGKTALVEGLALKIIEKTVPDILQGTEIYTLDLGLLQAGAGVKGEFEKRLQQVIEEVQQSTKPIILFIDEAHTLIGAGGNAGGSDAANLLKPALARGELRTIAATTWSEYKQYFERDAALDRRFQLVKVEEPTDEQAIKMLTGLKKHYESFHGLVITDMAIEQAVLLSRRYMTGKQLPDKAIDLLDMAAARVKMSQQSPLGLIQTLKSDLAFLTTKMDTKQRDYKLSLDSDLKQEIDLLEQAMNNLSEQLTHTEQSWQDSRDCINEIKNLEAAITQQNQMNQGRKTLKKIEQLKKKLVKSSTPISWQVEGSMIAEVVADLTGVPITSLVKDELKKLNDLEKELMKRIVGQENGLTKIAAAIRTRRLGLGTMQGPQGIFLLAGPTGIGKTETARALADLLCGGERFLTTINMSEYQESHTVSQLKGSPPGYVGYGEGGILTEAVRQKPYSVILLDEIEKAHPDVLNLFYQVFDRGIMRDGEGREINFRNTIIIITSNLAAETIEAYSETEATETKGDLMKQIEPDLLTFFAPALLARMQIIPYLPLSIEQLSQIVILKLDQLAIRLKTHYQIDLDYDKRVVRSLAEHAKNLHRGARAVNQLIEYELEPTMAHTLLPYLIDKKLPSKIRLEYDKQTGLDMFVL